MSVRKRPDDLENLFGARVRCEIQIVDGPAQERVANRPPDKRQVKAGGAECAGQRGDRCRLCNGSERLERIRRTFHAPDSTHCAESRLEVARAV